MENKAPNYSAMINVINIIHGSLIIFPTALAGVAVYINETSPIATGDLDILSYVSIVVLIVAFPLSSILFKNNIKSNAPKTLPKKIAAYQTAHLIRMAIFESAGLIAAVATMQTGNYYNLVVLLIVMVMFFWLRPTPSKIALDLELSPDEKLELES